MKLNILTARTDRDRHEFRMKFSPDESYFDGRYRFDEAEFSGHYQMEGDSDDVFLEFEIVYSLSGACDSCGEPARLEGTVKGSELVKKGAERPLSETDKIDGESDFYTYDGDEIDLGKIAGEALLLNVPSKLLCREDCKGLCPKCGKNLNDGDCGCTEDYSNSPFAKLLNLKS